MRAWHVSDDRDQKVMSERNDQERDSSSLILQSYQELYELLINPVPNGSDKKLDNLLKPRVSQLRACTNPFGRPSPESKRSIESGKVKLADGTTVSVSNEDKQEALSVSARLQIDEIEALVLLRSCLIHVEHSTLDADASTTWDADLKDALEAYYFQQRLHVLRVFLPILSASGDPQHPFNAVTSDIKQSVMPDDGAFALELVNELDRRTKQILPAAVTSDSSAASRWARQVCREQICLLEVLFGVLWELETYSGGLVVRLFDVLFASDCGQMQANSNYLMDEEGHQLLSDLESVWVLVGLQVLAFERVSEGATLGKRLRADPEALLGLHKLIIGSFRLVPRYGPLLMAWSIWLFDVTRAKEQEETLTGFAGLHEALISTAPDSPFYQRCAEIALGPETGLFVYISTLLDSPVLNSAAAASKASGITTPNAYTYRLTIHFLIVGMADTLSLGYVEEVDAFLEVVVKLFGSGESNIVASLGHMYWTEDWVRSPKRQQLLQIAALRFPVQPRPLIRILRALSGGGDDGPSGPSTGFSRQICVEHVYRYLAEMTGYTHVIQPSHLQSSAFDVRSDAVIGVRSIQLPGGITLPARSVGQTLSTRSPGTPLAVRWSHPYSGWRVLLDILLGYIRTLRNQSLDQAVVRAGVLSLADIGMGTDDLRLLVTDILRLLGCIAEGSQHVMDMLMNNLSEGEDLDSESAPPDLVQVSQIILEGCLSHATPGSIELATNALGILKSLLPTYPGRVWPYLRSTHLLFATPLFAAERALGDYTMTSAIINLVDALRIEAQVMSLRHAKHRILQQMKSDVLLNGLTFVHNEIWLGYSGWRYSRLSDRFNIGSKIAELYCAILDSPEQPGGSKADDVFGPTTRFLLDAFLHNATVPCIAPLVSALSSGHELLRSLNHAHRFAEADSLHRLLKAHLRLSRLIIGRKSPTEGLSLLEQTFFTNHKKRSALDAVVLMVEDKLVPLEAIRLLTTLTTTPASMVSHISSPQRVVDAVLRIIRNPYEEISLRIEAYRFVSQCIATQRVLGRLFISGEYKAPQGTSALDKESIPTISSNIFAPQIALDIVDNREILWEVNPVLLTVALELLDNIWQHALEYMPALDSIRANPKFWADLSALAATEVDFPDSEVLVGRVTYGGTVFSDRPNIPDICYRAVAKAHAVHIIALDIGLAQQKDMTNPPPSLVAFERISKDIRKFVRAAVSRRHKLDSTSAVRKFVEEEVPGLRIDAFRPAASATPRNFGDDYILELSKVKDCAWYYIEDEPAREEWNQRLLVRLCQLNLEWSLADSHIALTRSWVRLLNAAAPWLRSKANMRITLLESASDVAELAGDGDQPGDLAVSIHSERLNTLLALAEALGLSKLADAGHVKQFPEFCEQLQRVIVNPRFSPLESVQENPNHGFHCSLLQIIYFTAHHGRQLLVSGSKLSAVQRQKIVSTATAALDFVIDSLRFDFDAARSVLNPGLDSDTQLMVLTFGQLVRPELFPTPSVWLNRCQNNDIIHISLELFVRLDLTGQAHPDHYRTNHQSLYARSILDFHTILAYYRNSAERLAHEGVMLKYSNNQLTSALESGAVDVLHIDLPGERSPAHQVWCRMLGITTALVGHLSYNSHFVDQDVTGFVRLYRRQILRTLEWSVNDPLTAPLVDEMLRVANLFHAIAQVSDSDSHNTLGRDFVHVAHRLLQQLGYALAHPKHTLSLFEPLTADERVLIEADETSGDVSSIIDPVGKPVLARVGMALFRVARVVLSAVMLFVKADNVVAKLDEAEWDCSWEKLQPTVANSIDDNSSIGTLIELGRTAIDVLRHLNSLKTPPAPSRGLTTPLLALPKFELQVARSEVQDALELVLTYSTSQVALWLREPGGERWEREIKGTVAEDLQAALGRAAGVVGGRETEHAALFEVLAGFLEGKLSA